MRAMVKDFVVLCSCEQPAATAPLWSVVDRFTRVQDAWSCVRGLQAQGMTARIARR